MSALVRGSGSARWWVVLWLGACHPGADTDTDVDSDTDTDSDTDSDTGVGGDEQALRQMIAGTGDAASVLHTIAWSDGLPTQTADGFLFVRLGDPTGWGVAGDFSGWEPVPLNPGSGFGWVEVAVPEPAGALYKFTNGDAWTADPLARSYDYDEFGEISLVRPGSTPRIDRWPGLATEGLPGRDLRVLVPPGPGPFPVVYAHDGQNLFDPDAFWGGWHLQDAVAGVGGNLLVVGIDNTVDRMDEYTHVPDVISGEAMGGRLDLYGALLEDHVRPHIEAVYGSDGHDALLGSSLGGLASLGIAVAHPERWDMVISLSGTLGWGRLGATNELMEQRWVAAGKLDLVVYLDSGGDPGSDACTDPDGDGFPVDDPDATDNYCTNRHMADTLSGLGYTWDGDLYHWWEPGAPHNEAAWAARVGRPLRIFADLSR